MRSVILPEFLTKLMSPRENSDGANIKSIAMVGGLVEDGELHPSDIYCLHDIFKFCAEKSISIVPDVAIGVVNLNYGHDFLIDPPQADMVVFASIFYNPGVMPLSNLTYQSPHVGETNIWHRSLVKSGARIAFNSSMIFDESHLPDALLSKHPFTLTDSFTNSRPIRTCYSCLTR